MNLKIITSRVLLCFPLLFTNAYAEEQKDLFAVTPENCGKMTLEKCALFMEQAKAYMSNIDEKIKASKKRINQMHEDALGKLSKESKKAE